MHLSLFCPKEEWERGQGHNIFFFCPIRQFDKIRSSSLFLPEEKLKTFSSRIFLLGKILVLTRWNCGMTIITSNYLQSIQISLTWTNKKKSLDIPLYSCGPNYWVDKGEDFLLFFWCYAPYNKDWIFCLKRSFKNILFKKLVLCTIQQRLDFFFAWRELLKNILFKMHHITNKISFHPPLFLWTQLLGG